MKLGEQLDQAIENVLNKLTGEDKVLAAELMIRFGELQARAQAGEDVARELRVVSSALNDIKVAEYVSVASEARSIISTLLGAFLAAL